MFNVFLEIFNDADNFSLSAIGFFVNKEVLIKDFHGSLLACLASSISRFFSFIGGHKKEDAEVNGLHRENESKEVNA